MKHWLFIAILLLMTLSSCFQEKEIFIPRNTPEDPAYLYTQLENRPTHFILNISEEDVYFTTPQKNVIRIQKGSLLDKKGNAFSGKAVMELIESTSLGDHIVYGKIPFYHNQSLESKNLLFLQFTSAGEKLFFNPSLPLEWYSNITDHVAPLQLYYEVNAENNNKEWVWKSASSVEEWTLNQGGNLISGKGCTFSLVESGWYIIANPHDFAGEITSSLCIQPNAGYNKGNTVVFGVSKEWETIIPLYEFVSETYFCHNEVKLPVNSGIKFVLISYREDGNHTYAEMDSSVAVDQTIKLYPQVLSVKEIINKLRGF